MTVKAVHNEVVNDLTTESFLAALIRLTSRRGLAEYISSDIGTNFRGAHTKLNELCKLLRNKKLKAEVEKFASENNVQWHFILPHAPNFGGLWKIMVKQFR